MLAWLDVGNSSAQAYATRLRHIWPGLVEELKAAVLGSRLVGAKVSFYLLTRAGAWSHVYPLTSFLPSRTLLRGPWFLNKTSPLLGLESQKTKQANKQTPESRGRETHTKQVQIYNDKLSVKAQRVNISGLVSCVSIISTQPKLVGWGRHRWFMSDYMRHSPVWHCLQKHNGFALGTKVF